VGPRIVVSDWRERIGIAVIDPSVVWRDRGRKHQVLGWTGDIGSGPRTFNVGGVTFKHVSFHVILSSKGPFAEWTSVALQRVIGSLPVTPQVLFPAEAFSTLRTYVRSLVVRQVASLVVTGRVLAGFDKDALGSEGFILKVGCAPTPLAAGRIIAIERVGRAAR